jgi:hypothetical protein
VSANPVKDYREAHPERVVWSPEKGWHDPVPAHTHPNGPICSEDWCGSPRRVYR